MRVYTEIKEGTNAELGELLALEPVNLGIRSVDRDGLEVWNIIHNE